MKLSKLSLISVVVCNLLFLVACDDSKKENTNNNQTSAASQSNEIKEEGYPTSKFNAYIGYLEHFRAREFKMPIGEPNYVKLRAGDFKAISSRDIESYKNKADYLYNRILTKYQGSIPELDDAATAIISAVNASSPKLQELETYVTSRKYEDDKGAQGKVLLEEVLPLLKILDDAELKFIVAIDNESNKMDEKNLADMKASGDILGYNLLAALKLAGEMHDVIIENPEQVLSDAGKVEVLNAQIVTLESYLVELKKIADESTSGGRRQTKLNEFYNKTQSFIGAYRNIRSNPTDVIAERDITAKYNLMIYGYNDIVEYGI